MLKVIIIKHFFVLERNDREATDVTFFLVFNNFKFILLQILHKELYKYLERLFSKRREKTRTPENKAFSPENQNALFSVLKNRFSVKCVDRRIEIDFEKVVFSILYEIYVYFFIRPKQKTYQQNLLLLVVLWTNAMLS